MLTRTEIDGCKKILFKLNRNDLFSIADTTTKKQIKVTSASEAVKAILEYTSNAVDLLKRKKMKREFLFAYLADEQVIVPTNIDKAGLIRNILTIWGTDVQELEEMMVDYNEDSNSSADSDNLIQSATNTPQPSFTRTERAGDGPQPSTSRDTGFQVNIQCNLNQYVNITNMYATNTSANGHVNTPSGERERSNISKQEAQPTPAYDNSSKEETMKNDGTTSDIQTLGHKFAEWFYENLNSHCPCSQKTPGDFGPHHFWDDAHLVLNSSTTDANIERIEGSFLVSQRFLAFAKDEHLMFCPNLSKDGIYVKSDPHGLVLILVCGTIHRNNECLGVFKQVFGLVKDPRYDSNWKIKMSKLEVKGTQITSIPKLEGNLDKQIMVF